MAKLPTAAAEYGVIRTYLETVAELPWNERSADDLDLKRAARVLDEDHFGLQDVKDRVLEFLAVRKLGGHTRSPLLAITGPPGTGRTSLASTIAEYMHTGRSDVLRRLEGAVSPEDRLAAVPTIVVFIFLQRYFIQGLTLGSTKG